MKKEIDFENLSPVKIEAIENIIKAMKVNHDMTIQEIILESIKFSNPSLLSQEDMSYRKIMDDKIYRIFFQDNFYNFIRKFANK